MAMTSTSGTAGSRPLTIRIREAARRWRLGRIMTVGLSLAAVAAGIVTYIVLAGNGGEGQPDPDLVRGLVVLDVVLALTLATLVAWRVVQVWARRRSGAAGSRLHVKLVVLFSLVAVTPAIVVAVLSALLIQFGIEQMFNSRVNAAIQDSRAVANAYLDEHRQVIGGDAMAMANDLSREGLTLISSPQLLERLVQTQTAIRALNEAVIFNSSGEVLSRAGLAYSLEASISQIPPWAFERARSGEVAVITSPGDDRVRALVMLQPGIDKDLFLYVGRLVDPRVMAQVERTNREAEEYERQKQKRFSLEIRFTGIYAIIAAVLLLGAIWVGLSVSSQLASPIMNLIDAAERVRGGDLSARVAVRDQAPGDEIDSLSRAFNRMTSQLATQRTELIEANRQLDERRRFSEAVLAGVTAGVIGLDREGRVELPNRSAAELLAIRAEGHDRPPAGRRGPGDGAHCSMRCAAAPTVLSKTKSAWCVMAAPVSCWCASSASRGSGEAAGYVVTFDDVTDLLVAQRQAAWADVARRIAHEIKNPLTPIQLSAERLKRKYLGQITIGQGDVHLLHRHDRPPGRRYRPHGRRILVFRPHAGAGDARRGSLRSGSPGGFPRAQRLSRDRLRDAICRPSPCARLRCAPGGPGADQHHQELRSRRSKAARAPNLPPGRIVVSLTERGRIVPCRYATMAGACRPPSRRAAGRALRHHARQGHRTGSCHRQEDHGRPWRRIGA